MTIGLLSRRQGKGRVGQSLVGLDVAKAIQRRRRRLPRSSTSTRVGSQMPGAISLRRCRRKVARSLPAAVAPFALHRDMCLLVDPDAIERALSSPRKRIS